MSNRSYAFLTSATAAARLEDIARFFNPPAAELVGRFAPHRPGTEEASGITWRMRRLGFRRRQEE